jgi:hypothetical protein
MARCFQGLSVFSVAYIHVLTKYKTRHSWLVIDSGFLRILMFIHWVNEKKENPSVVFSFSAMLPFTTHQCTIQCDAYMGALVSPFFML